MWYFWFILWVGTGLDKGNSAVRLFIHYIDLAITITTKMAANSAAENFAFTVALGKERVFYNLMRNFGKDLDWGRKQLRNCLCCWCQSCTGRPKGLMQFQKIYSYVLLWDSLQMDAIFWLWLIQFTYLGPGYIRLWRNLSVVCVAFLQKRSNTLQSKLFQRSWMNFIPLLVK